jgi:transposase
MEKQRNKVCGVDVHKRFSVATCLSRDGTKKTKEFTMDLEGLFEFKEWVIGNGCIGHRLRIGLNSPADF